MDIRLLNQTFSIDPLTVIVRDNGVYAKVQLPGRDGQTFTHYVPVDRRLTGMLYTVEPDQRTLDNILALTEILNTRDPERQKSRDLYIYQLYCEIADTVAA